MTTGVLRLVALAVVASGAAAMAVGASPLADRDDPRHDRARSPAATAVTSGETWPNDRRSADTRERSKSSGGGAATAAQTSDQGRSAGGNGASGDNDHHPVSVSPELAARAAAAERSGNDSPEPDSHPVPYSGEAEVEPGGGR